MIKYVNLKIGFVRPLLQSELIVGAHASLDILSTLDNFCASWVHSSSFLTFLKFNFKHRVTCLRSLLFAIMLICAHACLCSYLFALTLICTYACQRSHSFCSHSLRSCSIVNLFSCLKASKLALNNIRIFPFQTGFRELK